MNLEEKQRFVDDLIRGVKSTIKKKLVRVPEEWDSRELRWFISEHFDEVICPINRKNKRYRDYNNFRIINCL